MLRGQPDERCRVVDFEPGQQVAAVGFDGEGTQKQSTGNILAGEPLRDELQNLLFAARERSTAATAGSGWSSSYCTSLLKYFLPACTQATASASSSGEVFLST